jgi:hypothetical protein
LEDVLPSKIGSSVSQSMTALKNLIKSMHKLAPGVVIVGVFLAAFVAVVSLISSKLMVAVICLLVLVISILIYTTTEKYGEAALSLVAGLLTAFSVTWTPSNFIAFFVIWIVFSAFVLLFASVKIASKCENIYRHAAIYIDEENTEEIEKKLRTAGESTKASMLGPVERAEIIRFLAFRGIPIESMNQMMVGIETLKIVTGMDYMVITGFLVDIYKMFSRSRLADFKESIDFLFKVMKNTPATPEEFFEAYSNSKHLVFSKQMEPLDFIDGLYKAFEDGITPNAMYKHLSES